MAVKRQVIETRTSDLSGEASEGVFSNKGSLNGKSFKLDLTPGEAATLEGLLAPYFAAYEDVKASGNGNSTDGDDAKSIRQWGRDHGFEVEERGKLSASLKSAYYAAQANPGNGQDGDTATGKAPAKAKS